MPFNLPPNKEPSNVAQAYHAFAQVCDKIECYLDLLLGNLYDSFPDSLDGFLAKNGATKEQIAGMSPIDKLQKAGTILRSKPTRSQILDDYLDLIFEARYGWTKEQSRAITFTEALLALEHALDDDMKDPKGIWKLTQ